jgi:hypothetical protein
MAKTKKKNDPLKLNMTFEEALKKALNTKIQIAVKKKEKKKGA